MSLNQDNLNSCANDDRKGLKRYEGQYYMAKMADVVI